MTQVEAQQPAETNQRDPAKIFPVSWDQFHRDSRALAWRLERRRAVRGDRLHHPRRPGAGGDRRARTWHQADRDGVRIELYRHQPGRIDGAQGRAAPIVALGGGQGVRVLLVDDLVDTGKTAKVVRELVPRAHLATVYAKPMGRPLVDTFITEVSQDTWIYFPWDTGLAFQPPINEAGL